MSIFKGKNLSVEIVGESHSPEMKMTVKGFPKFLYDEDKLLAFMGRRKASSSAFSTPRKEDDIPIFENVNNCLIDGDFSVIIKNNNVKSKDYNSLYGKPRPSHADYAWHLKDGALDFKGGGRFSARLTAVYSVLGGLCKEYLESKGIFIGAYLQSVGKVQGKSYRDSEISFSEIESLGNNFPSLSKASEMLNEIENARLNGDSVGAVSEVIVYNLPAGVGDNLFEGLEGKISNLIFSIPAVKGVEFGSGFEMSGSYGSKVNDSLYYENGEVKLKSNNNGGINGGISNGFNLTMRVAFKPTPSISIEQDTVDLITKENVKIKIEGRHDACVAVRGVPCLESAVAIALVDEILG
ncbi:MAG: chorismate synthase [Clostridiales bacterium]|nr:chorismate synthase [Clostridiales bacterium]